MFRQQGGSRAYYRSNYSRSNYRDVAAPYSLQKDKTTTTLCPTSTIPVTISSTLSNQASTSVARPSSSTTSRIRRQELECKICSYTQPYPSEQYPVRHKHLSDIMNSMVSVVKIFTGVLPARASIPPTHMKGLK